MIRLSRNQLKILAMVFMLIDHLGEVLTVSGTPAYTVMRLCIGRMAYPMFCALMVDGFWRTKRPWRHVLDLFLFAVLSECVFDFVLSHGRTWFSMEDQNVMFSWTIGFLMLIGLDFAMDSPSLDRFSRPPMCIFVVFISMLLAAGFSVDYDAIGIMSILLCYIAKRNLGDDIEMWQLTLLAAVGVAIGFGTYGTLLAPVPMFFYDKSLDRKPKSLVGKYGFYAFYPLHLAALAAGLLIFR